MYEASDKAIAYINKECIKLFRKLKTLKFDEANVLTETKAIYTQVDSISQRAYLELAKAVYDSTYDDDEELLLGIIAGREITKGKDFIVDVTKGRTTNFAEWLREVLNEYNPVTKYVWTHEVERKQSRCAEALISTKSPKEVNAALRYWTQQTSQYSDDIEYKATVLAYKDMGIGKVRWVTEEDDRVCPICEAREGKVYPIDDIPPKPHYGCRCSIEPIKGSIDEDN